jgi:hypothetical protein
MKYKEEVRDLSTVPNDYYFAHCISADFRMGEEFAVDFCLDMRLALLKKCPHYLNLWRSLKYDGDCILEGRVLNLITKERYWMKPTYRNLKAALSICAMTCKQNDIHKVAMPVIDRLQWDNASAIIKETFADMDIEILVCKREA